MYSHALIKSHAFKTHHVFVQILFYKTLFLSYVNNPISYINGRSSKMNNEFRLPKHCCDYCIIHSIQRTKKTKELPSKRNKIPKPNQKNPKQQQKDKLTEFKLKRNLLLMSVSP